MQTQKKVLIAEESGDFLKKTVSSFRTYGFECVTVARDGAEVAKALEAASPDIFVTTAFLARYDAIELLRRIPSMRLKKRPVTEP